jgi:hypothetical protein
MLAQHLLGRGRRLGAEIVALQPARQPARVVPEQGMAARGETVRFGESEDAVGRPEIEMTGATAPDPGPFELVLVNDDSAFADDQIAVARIGEGARDPVRRARSYRRAKAPSAARGERVEAFGTRLREDRAGGGGGKAGAEAGQRLAAGPAGATPDQETISSVAVLRLAELLPTETSNSPGSTTRCISRFQKRKASGPSSKSTVRRSPGRSVTRSKPRSSSTGRVTELTLSRM